MLLFPVSYRRAPFENPESASFRFDYRALRGVDLGTYTFGKFFRT